MKNYVKTADLFDYLCSAAESYKHMRTALEFRIYHTGLNAQKTDLEGKELTDKIINLIETEYYRVLYYQTRGFETIELPSHFESLFFEWFYLRLKTNTSIQ